LTKAFEISRATAEEDIEASRFVSQIPKISTREVLRKCSI